MTYINKVAKLLLQLGYWDRFGAVSSRSITETCADADGKSGPAGRTATIARCGMGGTGTGDGGQRLTPPRHCRGNAARPAAR